MPSPLFGDPFPRLDRPLNSPTPEPGLHLLRQAKVPPFLILGPLCDLRSPQSLPPLKPSRTSHPKSGAQPLSAWAGAPFGKSWVSRAFPLASPRPSIPVASLLHGPNRPREGAAARGTPTQPGASYLGRLSESPGGRSWPAPSPGGAAALPAVRAVWPRSGPLLLALKLYKILIIKKARKKKESLHSPTPKPIFQGGGAERFVWRVTQTSARGLRGA